MEHRSRVSALIDPADWPAVAARLRAAAERAGLEVVALGHEVQRAFCEADNMLLDEARARGATSPVAELVHIDAALRGDAADREVTALVAGALPAGAPWYGTTTRPRPGFGGGGPDMP
ncbi:hypothetical protein [Corynebacterium sphenisci]|uniref:hypothetical protein n=1 Tax=Corynebacterium sphenisci TaxID=191493 RepID=UPI0026DF2AFD|nr:hypothetical protein [Corynebacterium sphenisci]MDO5731828.1 hypothetical protein [Corynebacterium sphenisci]